MDPNIPYEYVSIVPRPKIGAEAEILLGTDLHFGMEFGDELYHVIVGLNPSYFLTEQRKNSTPEYQFPIIRQFVTIDIEPAKAVIHGLIEEGYDNFHSVTYSRYPQGYCMGYIAYEVSGSYYKKSSGLFENLLAWEGLERVVLNQKYEDLPDMANMIVQTEEHRLGVVGDSIKETFNKLQRIYQLYERIRIAPSPFNALSSSDDEWVDE